MTESDSDLLATLENLARLRQNEALSEEEFQSLKTLILQRLSIQLSEESKNRQTGTGKLHLIRE